MGIVLKQSFKNTIVIFAAFAIGGVNALFLYTRFLTDEYYGLVVYLLSTANLLMPLTAFGVHYSIVKFYSSYASKKEKDKFLSASLLLPLCIALPFGFIGALFYEQIGIYISQKNEIFKDFTWVIYAVAIATAYFEVFYAWAKVHMQSVFGNILKELFSRVVALVLLLLVYAEIIDQTEFVYCLTGAYFLRTFIMMSYAFSLYRPTFTFQLPENYTAVFKYAFYIILAGSAGAILLDIDKVMLPQKEVIEVVAYYAVAVYIASVIEAPGRAMAQIVQPLTAKALNENNTAEIASLYKRTSINLVLICGLFFLLVNLNIDQLYLLIDDKYAGGVYVVFMISLAKLYTLFLGNNGAIISNSKYYKILLPYAVVMAVSVYFLNDWLIDVYGMNGAALSTLVVILIFNTLKLWYVKKKFNILPFTNKTGLLFLIIAGFYGVFYFWNFSFHPVVNIVLKSALITIAYLWFVWKMKISKEINSVLDTYL